jgi:hypothetical protein
MKISYRLGYGEAYSSAVSARVWPVAESREEPVELLC